MRMRIPSIIIIITHAREVAAETKIVHVPDILFCFSYSTCLLFPKVYHYIFPIIPLGTGESVPLVYTGTPFLHVVFSPFRSWR